MKFGRATRKSLGVLALGLATLLCAAPSSATIQGLKDYGANPVFNLVAGADYLSTGDGGSHYFWGFGPAATGQVQYPGPTLILMQGATVTINVTNNLPEPVSLIFPGQGGLSTPAIVGGVVRSLGAETAPGATRSYVFTASKPGTYVYESGTNMAKQVYLGLFGVIVVRPTGYTEAAAPSDTWTRSANEAQLARFAYGGDPATQADTTYHREYLFIQTELDPRINAAVEAGEDPAPSIADYHDVVWMYNGRAFPDTLFPDFTPMLPSQPYGSFATSHPGEKVLVRLVTVGREAHPFHMHGNHTRVIAHDGNLLKSAGSATADLSYEVFTLSAWSGQTYDGIWEWTGTETGWDVYGDVSLNPALAHTCSNPACPDTAPADGFDDGTGAACYDATTWEYCPDHGRPFPTALPDPQVLTYGAFFSGTPFMGSAGFLPPGEGGFNPYAGFFFMWHSHTEGELSNNDIFPGGMITMMGVLPMSAPVSY